MKTSLDHLPQAKRQQLAAIKKIIVGTIYPEKIILFGMHATSAGEQGFFEDGSLPFCLLNYDLLVITQRGDRRYDYEVQDIVENRCHSSIAVNVMVHDIDYVNGQLAAGHYFFSMIRRDAILLHDAQGVPLVDSRDPDFQAIRLTAEHDFKHWWLRAGAFFRSARFNCQHKEWKIAVFLLHQAAEQAYQAILLAFMGYKPCTHNLDKLRRYTNRFSIELSMLFPRTTPEEDRIFRLLLQGYVDARYKEDYRISEQEVSQLAERIERLLSIAERVCRNRFISLGKMAEAEKGKLILIYNDKKFL